MSESALKSNRRFSWYLFGSISFGVVMLVAGLSHAAGKPVKPPPVPSINPAIVYEVAIAGTINLAVANADGTNQKVVLSHGRSPSWSPDGTQIIFASNVPSLGIYRLGINRSTGQAIGTPQLITGLNNGYFPFANPVWSPVATPDGRFYIAYSDNSGGSDYSIYLVEAPPPLPFSPPVMPIKFKLTNPSSGGDLYPSWSPDATRIVVTNDKDNSQSPPYDIQIITLETGCSGQSLCEVPPRQSLVGDVVGSPLQSAATIGNTAWGNASDEIAVTAFIPPNGNNDIWIVPVGDPATAGNLTNTNTVNPLDRNEVQPTWSPNDSQIMHRALRGLCNNKDKNFQGIVVRNLDGNPIDGCEEKILINGGYSPSWWRNHVP